MKVALGSDDAGLPLFEVVRAELARRSGIEAVDFSAPVCEGVEQYPDIAERVAVAVAGGGCDRGILICGTGLGMAMSACKVPGIRAALCHDTYSAERARKSNNAQVLTMGARVIGPELARAILNIWLDSEFDERGPSAPKVARIEALDEKYRRA